MAVTYNLAPQPRLRFYYPAGAGYGALAGKPLANGKVYTFSSLNHATPKAAYTSNIGDPPPAHTNPIILDINGEAAIYWEYDDEKPHDLYYIEVYDESSSPPLGTPILTADNYDGAPFPDSSDQTTPVEFNFIRNAQFSFPWFKKSYNLKESTATNPTDIASWVGAQWFFSKNNNATIETLTYQEFTLGQTEVLDNPIYYISWNVGTGSGSSGETFKVISQPLTWFPDFNQNSILPASFNLMNVFSGQEITLQFWARSTTSATIKANIRQFFGTGGSPNADIVTLIIEQQLTNEWIKYSATVKVPSVNGKNVGSTTQGWTQFEFGLPLNAVTGTNIDIANVQVEIGDVLHAFQYRSPPFEKASFDIWFQETSGVMKTMIGSQEGWLLLRDSLTIGNKTSGAVYAFEHAYALFAACWNNMADAQAAVSAGRGTSALTDFDAGKTLTFPVTNNSVFGNIGTGSFANGEHTGDLEATLAVANLPPHVHSYQTLDTNVVGGAASNNFPITFGTLDTTDGSEHGLDNDPFSIVQPTTFFKWYIKI